MLQLKTADGTLKNLMWSQKSVFCKSVMGNFTFTLHIVGGHGYFHFVKFISSESGSLLLEVEGVRILFSIKEKRKKHSYQQT